MSLPIEERYLVAPITAAQELRARVWDASNGVCAMCGKQLHPLRDFQVDHIIPRCAGGSDDMDNLRACCYRCNRLKCDTHDKAYCRRVNGPGRPHGFPVNGERLRELMKQSGLTTMQLSNRARLSFSVVLRAERGERIMGRSSSKIAMALGVDETEFMRERMGVEPKELLRDD